MNFWAEATLNGSGGGGGGGGSGNIKSYSGPRISHIHPVVHGSDWALVAIALYALAT